MKIINNRRNSQTIIQDHLSVRCLLKLPWAKNPLRILLGLVMVVEEEKHKLLSTCIPQQHDPNPY